MSEHKRITHHPCPGRQDTRSGLKEEPTAWGQLSQAQPQPWLPPTQALPLCQPVCPCSALVPDYVPTPSHPHAYPYAHILLLCLSACLHHPILMAACVSMPSHPHGCLNAHTLSPRLPVCPCPTPMPFCVPTPSHPHGCLCAYTIPPHV